MTACFVNRISSHLKDPAMRRKLILLQRIGFLGMFIVLLLTTMSLINSIDNQAVSNVSAVVKPMVVMELFTSQGCSSCPPADALLADYATSHNEQIIPLSFHVDYWNRLGWTDSFSSSVYSARQQWYSRHIPKATVYTPQLVINGRAEVVGNKKKLVDALVQKELTAKAFASVSIENITIDNHELSFYYKASNITTEQVLNIAVVQKEATTNIRAGENKGIQLSNRNIVRAFNTQVLTNKGSGKINLPVSFKADGYAVVLYVQNKNDLIVSTAAIKDL
jgi:hypothetical protein